MNKVVVLVGGSGCGKTAVANNLVTSHGFSKVVTSTTRKPRPGEANGKDYWFLSEEEFLKKESNNDFVESTVYNGQHYGTSKDAINRILDNDQSAVIVMDRAGAEFVKKTYGEKALAVHMVRDRYNTVLAILKRDIPNEEKAKRICDLDKEDADVNPDFFDVSITNKSSETTVARLAQILVNIISTKEQQPAMLN